MNVRALSPRVLDVIFGVYRAVTKSHWKPNALEEVQRALEVHGKFERLAGTPQNWSSKLVIEKKPTGLLDVRIEVNPLLPQTLKASVNRMQTTFNAGLEKELRVQGLQGP